MSQKIIGEEAKQTAKGQIKQFLVQIDEFATPEQAKDEAYTAMDLARRTNIGDIEIQIVTREGRTLFNNFTH